MPPVYLDCAASTPLDPRVREAMLTAFSLPGNPASRSHRYGHEARRLVEKARDQAAALAGCRRGELIFTSGATESCNLAILGLAPHLAQSDRRHILASAIEHRAVLEPLERLAQRGFEVELVPPGPSGAVNNDDLRPRLRPDTGLVALMAINNETGIRQPTEALAEALLGHHAYLFVDAAQAFGKELDSLRHPRIDLLAASAHKLHGPQGIGLLVTRRRGRQRPPIEPLCLGGGHELGLRPGTLPLALAVGFGCACQLAAEEHKARARMTRELGSAIQAGLAPLAPQINGDPALRCPGILNISLPGLDAELVMDRWSELAAISDGAACSSQSQTCSHVLSAMKLSPERIGGAVRLSWTHDSPLPDLPAMCETLRSAPSQSP